MRTILSPILVIAALTAQEKPTRPAALHLPAGSHTVVELLQLAEQAVRRPIRPMLEDRSALDARLRLQVDLTVQEHRCHDMLDALLSTRGIVLVRGDDDGTLEARNAPDRPAAWLPDRAQDLTLEQLFARPALAGPVRVVASTEAAPIPLIQGLRVFLAGPRRPLTVAPVERGIEVVGLADEVRFAIRQIAEAAPDVAAAIPSVAAPPWPRTVGPTVHRIARGRWAVVDLVDRYASCLGRNIVASPALAKLDAIELAEDVVGDDMTLEEHVSALLWQRRALVLPLSAADGLHEAVVLGPDDKPSPSRSAAISVAELKARPRLVALVTCVPEPGPWKVADLVNAARTAHRQRGTSTLRLGMLAGRVHVTGLSDEVAGMLDALTAGEAAPADRKR